jgi:hypothetical protein
MNIEFCGLQIDRFKDWKVSKLQDDQKLKVYQYDFLVVEQAAYSEEKMGPTSCPSRFLFQFDTSTKQMEPCE